MSFANEIKVPSNMFRSDLAGDNSNMPVNEFAHRSQAVCGSSSSNAQTGAGRILVSVDLRDKRDALETVTFDTRTLWLAKELMPNGFDPAHLIEVGTDPGLGIRSLHAAGITGKGVNVEMWNPCRSVKDRLGTTLIEDAKRRTAPLQLKFGV